MVRILVFAPYYPPHQGGLENYAAELHQYLAQNGYQLTILAPRLPADAPTHDTTACQQVVLRYPAWEIISNYPLPMFWRPQFWRQLFTALTPRPHLVISHTRFFIASLLAQLVARALGRPRLHFEHGSAFVSLSNPHLRRLAKFYDLLLGRYVLRSSWKIVAISGPVATFVERLSGRQAPVIHRGLRLKTIDRLPPTQFDDGTSHPLIVVTACRLIAWKGVAYTLQAIASLPADIQATFKVLIIGTGEEYEPLQQLVSPAVTLLGSKSWTGTIAIMKAAHIYIHSSLPGGGLSTSLLEAMYCGCAVIATPNEGATDIIHHGHNGYLIPAANTAAIAESLVFLASHPADRQRVAAAAHAAVAQEYTWALAGKKITSLITSRPR